MGAKSILVLEADPIRYEDIDFLLRLAGYQALKVNDEAEALNWITRRMGSPAPIDLLLVNRRFSAQALLLADEELSRLNIEVPFVIVENNSSPKASATFWGRRQLPERFFFCQRNEIFHLVRALVRETGTDDNITQQENSPGI